MRARRKSKNRTAARPALKRPKRPRFGATYRQGDVLLRRVEGEDLPTAGSGGFEQDRVVLAFGEATGHAHAVDGAHAVLWYKPFDLLLEVHTPTALVHEEHGAIPLEPGHYAVIRQREFTGNGRAIIDDRFDDGHRVGNGLGWHPWNGHWHPVLDGTFSRSPIMGKLTQEAWARVSTCTDPADCPRAEAADRWAL